MKHKNKLLFIKLGGSIVTDKTREKSLRHDLVRNIADEIRDALNESQEELSLLLAHGGGAYGHIPGEKYKVKQGIHPEWKWQGFHETHLAMLEMNIEITEIFRESGLHIVPVQPFSIAVASDGRLISMKTEVISRLIEFNQIPIIYGDVIIDSGSSRGFTIISTEEQFTFLANELNPSVILLIGDVQGVHKINDRTGEFLDLIPVIDHDNLPRILNNLGSSKGIDVTGGMRSKICELFRILEKNRNIRIGLVSAKTSGLVKRAILDINVCGTQLKW